MFGSVRTVFTSRWKALWWACGILLTAYCSVPSPDDAPHKAAAEKHVNPWAKDYHPEQVQQGEHMDFKAMMARIKEEQRRQQEGEPENPWAKKQDGEGS